MYFKSHSLAAKTLTFLKKLVKMKNIYFMLYKCVLKFIDKARPTSTASWGSISLREKSGDATSALTVRLPDHPRSKGRIHTFRQSDITVRVEETNSSKATRIKD